MEIQSLKLKGSGKGLFDLNTPVSPNDVKFSKAVSSEPPIVESSNLTCRSISTCSSKGANTESVNFSKDSTTDDVSISEELTDCYGSCQQSFSTSDKGTQRNHTNETQFKKAEVNLPHSLFSTSVSKEGTHTKILADSAPGLDLLPAVTLPESTPLVTDSSLLNSLNDLNAGGMPVIEALMKTHLAAFIPYKESKESCSNVLDNMTNDPVASSKAYLLFNILVSVSNFSHVNPQESVQADKEVYSALDELYRKAISTLRLEFAVDNEKGGPSSVGPLTYFDRLTECIADTENGRTLYQKFIEMGMEKSLQSFFSKSILSQENGSGYEPSLALDKIGNTVLHLAAMSGSVSILEELLERHGSQLTPIGNRDPNHGYYWILSCLHHKNDQGKTVLDLAKSPGFRLSLKRTYRTLAHFLRRTAAPR